MFPSLPARRTYIFGEFELQLAARALLRAGERVPLGSKAFEVLACLVEHAGEVVSKETLLATVWPNAFVEESNLTQHIFALRKALGDHANLITTVPGRGYQFTGAVRESRSVETGHGEIVSGEAATETIVHTVRERARVVIEETIPVDGPPQLQAGTAASASGGRKVAVYALVLAVLAAAGWGGWRWQHRKAAGLTHSLLVADFANSTGDEAFDRSLKRALEIELGQSPALNLMSSSEAVGLLPEMGQKPDAPVVGELARELCVRGNRQLLVAGGITSVGSTYLLTLEATDCNSGRKVASSKAEAPNKDAVLAALDRVADDVRKKLGESATSLGQYEVPISQATTSSLDALKAYSMGGWLSAQGAEDTQVLGYYQRAVELDPAFAMAYGALANTYYNLNEFELASENYKKAFDLSDRASAHEKLILRAHYYGEGVNDMVQAIREYQMWAVTYPQEWAPQVNICNGYTQLGQYAEAMPACHRGVEMQPDRGVTYSVLARALKDAGRFDEVKEVGRQAAARAQDSAGLHSTLLEVALIQHDEPTLATERAWAAAHATGWYAWYAPLLEAGVLMTQGRFGRSEELYQRAYEAAEHGGLTESARNILLYQATVETNVGREDAARRTMARITAPMLDSEIAGLLWGMLGDVKDAKLFIAKHEADTPPGTMMQYVFLPSVRAAMAMRANNPLKAIKELEPSVPYEMAEYDVPAMRAEAYLRAREFREAELEYRKILANPGINVASPLYVLSHLGLARALVAQGDTAGGRAEYRVFLAAWKDADPDMPLLKAAKAEVAKLGE